MTRLPALAFSALVVACFAAANPVAPPLVDLIAFGPPGEVSLVMAPDGSGTPFSAAWDADGNPVNATLRIYLVNEDHGHIEDHPAEDIWLEFDVGGGTADGCIDNPYHGGIFHPDGDSDSIGMIEWVLPLRGGGWSMGPVWITITGMPAMDPDYVELPPLPIRVNSPDISGDLEVDLTDITLFTQDLGGSYQYRSDLHWDGVIDLSDIVIFVQGIGAAPHLSITPMLTMVGVSGNHPPLRPLDQTYHGHRSVARGIRGPWYVWSRGPVGLR